MALTKIEAKSERPLGNTFSKSHDTNFGEAVFLILSKLLSIFEKAHFRMILKCCPFVQTPFVVTAIDDRNILMSVKKVLKKDLSLGFLPVESLISGVRGCKNVVLALAFVSPHTTPTFPLRIRP